GLDRVVAGFALEEAGIIQEAGNAVRRQRANREPVLRTLEIKGHALGIVLRQQRVERADLFDEATIAGAARIGNHDAIEGALLRAATGEPDLQSHFVLPFKWTDHTFVRAGISSICAVT